jgi:hypothetical protein
LFGSPFEMMVRVSYLGDPIPTPPPPNFGEVLAATVIPKKALYTRRETAICICPSSGGGRFEYTT